MRVKFWGTRGSLPVALNAEHVRAKVRRALELAVEAGIDSSTDLDGLIDATMPFPVKHTYGGNSSCVEIETGSDEFVLCDMGSGLRAFSQRLMEARGPGPFVFNLFVAQRGPRLWIPIDQALASIDQPIIPHLNKRRSHSS